MNKLSALILVVSAALIGVGIYFLLNPVDRPAQQQKETKQERIQNAVNLDPDLKTLTYDTYTNFDYGVLFKYPKDWEIKETDKYIRFYSPEVLTATNNEYGEKSDLLVEFNPTLPGKAKDVFANESKYEYAQSGENDIVIFQRVDAKTGSGIGYYVVQKDNKAIVFTFPVDHPMKNFITYMIDSVSFFEE